MEEIILGTIDSFGYFGIMFLIAIENIFPPIPSEIILSFGGFLTTYTHLTIFGMIISSTIGALIGAIILYMIGRKLSKERLIDIVNSKIGKTLRLKEEDIEKADKWFLKHGNKAVFFGRFVPIVRSLISIPAGSANMKLSIFIPLSLLGSLIWNSVLIYLGSFAKEAWKVVADNISFYSTIIGVCILIVGIISMIIFFTKRKDKNINIKKETE